MGVIVLIAIVAIVAYMYYWRFDVRRHPYRPCPRCGGKRRNPGSTARRIGMCRRCGGRGLVPRNGASR
jgi:hypothetical protein